MTEVDGVRERSPALSRHACLLTGDHQFAEDLLQSALASTFRHWRRLRGGARTAVSHRPPRLWTRLAVGALGLLVAGWLVRRLRERARTRRVAATPWETTHGPLV